MTPSARTEAVIELLTEILATPRPADTVASAYFRSRRFIGSKDRAAIGARLYRLMREYHRLSWWITRVRLPVTGRTLTLAGLLFDREHAGEHPEKLFTGGKYAPASLDEGELKLVKHLTGKEFLHPDMPERERAECPDWAYAPLKRALDGNFAAEMEAMMHPAALDLRVNTLKTTRDEALKTLQHDGFEAEAGEVSPLGIRVYGRPNISQHPLFADGAVEIQDQGSQLIALLADAKPGEQVVDFCAGAGGKTLAMGASMKNKGRIVAMDVLGGRLARAKLRFRRAGLHNIETRELSSERDKFVKRHEKHFDLVLVDAPCTGTGTWRRDPDKRIRQLGPGLETLVPLQKDILDSAQRMVKPGGRLVYGTCSLLPEENEDQMKVFLGAHADFALLPARDVADLPGAGDFLQLTPAQHGTDGFFCAVLTRRKSA
jgi:16S rRNA (cytosine967-C5)-methyltransferase